MYWLIETKSQLEEFKSLSYKDAFIEVIPYSPTIHPILNPICSFYIRPLDSSKGFILPLNHSETLNLELDEVLEVLKGYETLYVRDKKETLHYFIHKNIIDLTYHNIGYNLEHNITQNYFYRKFSSKEDINVIIPITKHYEFCEKIYQDLKENINKEHNKFFNTKTSIVFNAIEQNGIKINKPLFEDHFYEEKNDFVYTQYNLKTTTSRPSNSFKGVNYAALNKDDGSRKCFIPRNEKFVEYDINAYHPTILSTLIGYDFKGEDIHRYFAELYNVDYNKAKEITFKQLYGGIYDQYKEIEFFKQAQNYIDSIWDEFKTKGEISCPISKHVFKDENMKNMNPQKLLNYILQATETDMNVLLLWDIFKTLHGNNTKLVLYTYDSFTFDTLDEEEEVMLNIQNIFKKHNLQFKTSIGYNYGELSLIP